MNLSGVGAKLGLSGALECRDKDGNVLKVIHFNGAIPLADLNMTPDQARELIEREANGADDCK